MNKIKRTTKTATLTSLSLSTQRLCLNAILLLAFCLPGCSVSKDDPTTPVAKSTTQPAIEQTPESKSGSLQAHSESLSPARPASNSNQTKATDNLTNSGNGENKLVESVATQHQEQIPHAHHEGFKNSLIPQKHEPKKLETDNHETEKQGTAGLVKASKFNKISNKKPKIALIVDDIGYNIEKAKTLMQLNQPITLALIPNTPHAKTIAKEIENEGYELMLHIPMETIEPRVWEQGLTDSMERNQFDNTLTKMINDFPNAKGINNHGGSLLTQKREKMDWVMEALASEQLYFVDSRTIGSSVASTAAKEAGLGNLSRDVFLDNERSYESIEREMQKLQKIALRRGSAIGIGHPYNETLAVLQDMVPKMVSDGFEFVFISEITSNKSKSIDDRVY